MLNKTQTIELLKTLEVLVPNFLQYSSDIAVLCRGITLDENLGQHLLYSGCSGGRPYRMLMFVLLLNESANLKTDSHLAYHLLKEAYLMTDNIYAGLKNSTYPFVLADYLAQLESALPDRNPSELNKEEADLYNSLPDRFKVYRGMSNEEKVSGLFGISWSLEKDYALNYVFYKKNDVQSNFGWIAEMEIDKADIFAIWGVVGERKEIVINPRHCQGVNFEKVIRT